jgi:hypothetical protein
VNWLQYVVIVAGGSLWYYIQYWSNGSNSWPPGYTWQPGTTPWLPCWADDDLIDGTFATGLNGDTLPSGSKLQIALGTDADSGGVDTVTFSYTDPTGETQTGVFVPPVAHPINGFELNFVSEPGKLTTIFTTSAPDALISYSISSGELSVLGDDSASTCVGVSTTGETSNMIYSDINGAPGSTVTQTLLQPISGVLPSTLTFPSQQIGTTSLQQTVIAAPASGVTLTGISLESNSPDSPQFVWVPSPGDGNLVLQDGKLVITVWYRPTLPGPQSAQMLIALSDGSLLAVQLNGTGDATPLPILNISPKSLLFTAKKLTNHTVTLTNSGTAPLTINDIVIDGPSGFTFGTTCNIGSGGALNPGQDCAITVAYGGTVDASAQLVITHNAAGNTAVIDIEADVATGPQR